MAKQVGVYLTEGERKVISRASEISGLGYSAFLRFCGLKEAKAILHNYRKQKLEVNQ